MMKPSRGEPTTRVALDIAWRFGDRLRQARLAAGLSQVEAAKRAGVGDSFWSLVERAERMPHLTTLQEMAHVVGTDIARLLAQSLDEHEGVQNLLAFIRARELGEEDVDRLLQVARIMFPAKGGE